MDSFIVNEYDCMLAICKGLNMSLDEILFDYVERPFDNVNICHTSLGSYWCESSENNGEIYMKVTEYIK